MNSSRIEAAYRFIADEENRAACAHAIHFPSLLRRNGPGHALAYLLEQSAKRDGAGAKSLLRHLGERLSPALRCQADNPDSIIESLLAADSRLFALCEIELRETADWLKRFAEVFEQPAPTGSDAPSGEV